MLQLNSFIVTRKPQLKSSDLKVKLWLHSVYVMNSKSPVFISLKFVQTYLNQTPGQYQILN